MRKKRNIFSLIGLIVILILGPLVYFRFIRPKLTSASWFDDGWHYRKSVQISNGSGSNLTDFQVSIQIGTSALISQGKMQSDCDDIRITDNQGNLLPHWVEENNPGCNAVTDTKVWVKAPSIPSSGGTVYVYYGNPSAKNVENGDNVFLEFDDFSKDLSKWIIESNPNTTYAVSNGVLTITNTSGDYSSAVIGSAYTDFIIQTRYKVNSSVTHGGLVFRGQTTAADNGYQYIIRPKYLTNGDNRIQKRVNSSQSSLLNEAELPSKINADTWNTIEFKVNGTNIDSYFNNQQSRNGNMNDTTYLSGKNGVESYDGTAYHDYFFIRKYASTDPSASSGQEEISKAPVAYWSFDEGQGTTVNDESSMKNNGTLGTGNSAPAWQTEDMCVSGKCLYFDGVNDYVSVPDNNRLSFTNKIFSLSVWFKSSTIDANYSAIVNKGAVNNWEYALRYKETGFVQFYMWDSSGGTTIVSVASKTSLADGKWHHIATSLDGSIAKLYVDGVLQDTDNDISGTITNGSAPLTFASNGWGTNYGLMFIDEPKIYPYARSAREIKADYNARGTQKGTSVQIGDKSASINNGLIGYWKMDEASWNGTAGEVIDSSGNSNNGVGVGTTKPTTGAGKFGNGGVFDGISQYINGGTNPSLNLVPRTNAMTFSLWVNVPAGVSTIGYLLSKKDTSSASTTQYGIYHTVDGILTFNLGSSSTTVNSGDLRGAGWKHIVLTVPTSTTGAKLYINGTEQTFSSGIGEIGTATASYSTLIGARHNGSEASSALYYSGSLDEVRIYNRALSPSEVQNLYEWAPGPVAYYNFNEGVGSSAYDTSGNGNNGGWSGTGNHWDTGKFGKAGKFNGSNDWVNIGSKSIIGGAGAITLSGWANYQVNGSNKNIIYFSANSATGTLRVALRFDANNKVVVATRRTDSDTITYYTSDNAPTPNIWHYIVGIINYSTPEIKIYVDGILQSGSGTINFAAGTLSNNTSATVEIGGQNLGTSSYFNGSLDEVKIYNYARTQKQIVSDMNAGHPNVGSPVGSAVAHYKFDEGYGTTVNNSGNGGSVLNGTLGTGNSAPSWSQNGKFGKALSFDGSNDYIQILDNNSFSPSSISLSLWFKDIDDASTYHGLISKYSTATKDWFLRIRNDVLNFTQEGTNYLLGTTLVNNNQWHHVVGVYDSVTQNRKIYLDGKLEASDTDSNAIPNTTNNVLVGNDYTIGSGRVMNGLIDEVKIYNYALTADEIAVDYNRGSALMLGTKAGNTVGTGNTAASNAASQVYCIPGDTTSCSPPVAEWNFEEGIGTTAYDTSGNNYSGGLIGTNWIQGKFGKGLKLEANTDRIVISNLTSSSTSHTFNFWIKNNQAASTYKYLFDTTTTRLIPAWNAGTSGKLGFHDGAWRTSTVDAPNDGQWHLLSFIFDGSNSTASIYIDGVLKQNGLSYSPITMSGLATIGGRISLDAYTVLGSYDQIRIYDYVRTAAQIAWDYNKGAPVAHWKFDECQGATIHNSQITSSNLDGTLTVGASGSQNTAGTCALGIGQSAAWGNGSSGKYNASLNFDGTDDYVEAGTSPVFNFGTNDFSASVWTKTTFSSFQSILTKGNHVNNDGWTMDMDNASGSVRFILLDNTSKGITGKGDINDGNWHHVIGTRNNGIMNLYIDGKILGTSEGNTDSVTTIEPLSIAKRGGTGPMYFNGQIDDVKIWNYALTPLQIKLLYNQNSAIRFGE